MKDDLENLFLRLDVPMATPEYLNFHLKSWPPKPNFPVVIDKAGLVISRYKMRHWDISVWSREPRILYFENGRSGSQLPPIDKANADILRRVTAWMIWGYRGTRNANTLFAKFHLIRPIFAFCSEHGISLHELNTNPRFFNKFIKETNVVRRAPFRPLLELLHSQKDLIGATLIGASGLRKLPVVRRTKDDGSQTAYIPPRIFQYHAQRIREFLVDYRQHQERIEGLFDFCIDAYKNHDIARQKAVRMRKWSSSSPFVKRPAYAQDFMKDAYVGSFRDAAAKYGVEELLMRWCQSGKGSSVLKVTKFSHYLTMVNFIGMAYILSFSPMRIGEGWELRTDALLKHRDPKFGDIFILRGRSIKSRNDEEIWITSPESEIAIDVLASVARLRAKIFSSCENDAKTKDSIRLISEASEPWTRKRQRKYRGLGYGYPSYHDFISRNPRFFDQSKLKATREDIDLARLVTPSLDNRRFKIGKVWPISWHQLRRSLSVNMLASGFVSESSLQFELKHAGRSMALYYGQGYSSMKISQETRTHYLRTLYESLGRQISQIFTDRFVSPHGNERKSTILSAVGTQDCKKLEVAAKTGKISWRITLLGGCTSRGPCPYGGVDNIARCAGGDGKAPCIDAIFDRKREPQLRELQETISARLNDTIEESPYRAALVAQRRAVENALHVIATR
ncbi:hypothetical protein LMG6871_04313 [Ralstonia edaphis]|uniref:hypothetical protein n=1 Tax=Ralstonia edaphi TaxID=3058599 RepID=UPI0028F66C7C|nr:hypothetical protein [Ralstonia sp. LMG 6871]CAJ0720890.1 hypothetical protein LMG6871_04313 [Ralstonia sp. LMG 6871]